MSVQPSIRTVAIAIALTVCSTGACLRAANYYVDATGANGAYTSITAAIAAITGENAANRANIFVAPGTYTEQPTLSKPYVSIVGSGTAAADVVISYNGLPNQPPGSFGATFTVTSAAVGFMASNLTFQNSTPDQNVTQALAARISADQSAVSNCRFLGYQDTMLLDNKSRVYLNNCFVTGDTDFIYGNATAVFDHSTIESTDRGYITAANTSKDTANGLVFLDCSLVSGTDRSPLDDGTTTVGKTNLVNLGRPWQWTDSAIKSSTVFIRTKMGPDTTTAGWDPWNSAATGGDPNPGAVTRYSEYGSMDLSGNPLPLSAPTGLLVGRVSWEDQMTAAQASSYTLANIFGGASTIRLWNTPGSQPDGTGVTYVDTRSAWDPVAQLALLPVTSVPEPASLGLLAISALVLSVRRPRQM